MRAKPESDKSHFKTTLCIYLISWVLNLSKEVQEMTNDIRKSVINKDDDNDNTEFVRHMIRKYNGKKDYIPVKNTSLDIETEENVYKVIRLNDEQFRLLCKNSISIFEDYGHIIFLSRDEDIVFSSFSKMYAALKMMFGESGKYYDDWKGSFSFPFLIHFHKGEEEYGYLMNLMNLRSSMEFNMAKLICADDDRFERGVLHDPFEEFSRKEITYFINYFVGFLTGYFEVVSDRYDEPFLKIVESNLILFGYKDGSFFDYEYEDEKEFKEAIQDLTPA